jgi:hypothetical protein
MQARAGSDPQETAALLVSTPGLLDRPADALTAEELELAFSRCRPPAAGAPGPAQASTAVMAPGHDPASAVRGTARITTITAATPPEALDGLLAAIATAPRLAITPVLGKAGGGVVKCWQCVRQYAMPNSRPLLRLGTISLV